MAQQITNQIAEQVLNSIQTTLTQDDIESLHLLFDKLLLPALDIIDQGKVTKLHHPTLSRNYYQVASSSSPLSNYTVFWDQSQGQIEDNTIRNNISSRIGGGIGPYCPCPSFQVKMWAEAGPSASPVLMCKHLLAARIAERLSRVSNIIPQSEDAFLGTLIWEKQRRMETS